MSIIKQSFLSPCAGRREVHLQGDIGNELFIIYKGSCIVSIEREGIKHKVARLIEGDIVGEMALKY